MNHRPSPPCQTKRVFECSGFVPSTRSCTSLSHQANRWPGLEHTRLDRFYQRHGFRNAPLSCSFATFTPFGANAVVSLHLPELRFRHYSISIISIIVNAAETAPCCLHTCILVETCTRRGLLIQPVTQPAYNMWVPSKDSDDNLKIQSVRSPAGSACGNGPSLGWLMLGSALLDILSQFLESHLVVDRHNAHRALQCLDEGIDCSSGTPTVFVPFLNRLLAPTGTDQCPHEHRVRSEMWA